MNYIDILNDSRVIEQYGKIDIVNPYPFNHGLKHVTNVCNIMNKLCSVLNIVGEEKEALLVACALHDIGQVDGREEHGKKAMIFTMNTFENELKNNMYYSDILKAIEIHDNACSPESELFYLLVQFCDKMDFSKDRSEDNYREKFRYYCYENIDEIIFIYDDNYFGIDIVTSNIDNFEELFLKENFAKKVINSIDALARKLGRKPIMMNNSKKIEGVFNEKQLSYSAW